MERLKFKGAKGKHFWLVIGNIFLTVLTLGIYSSWAFVKEQKYFNDNTYLLQRPFGFTGTGGELFKIVIKALILIGLGYAVFFIIFQFAKDLVFVGMMSLYVLMFIAIIITIHDGIKFFIDSTTWDQHNFEYSGDKGELTKLYVKGLVLTILTLGIYGFWFRCEFYDFLLRNTKYKKIQFEDTSTGSEYFLLNLKGIFLTLITCGIYGFKFFADLYRYDLETVKIYNQDGEVKLKTSMTGVDVFKLFIGNYLIILFSFGIAAPVALYRRAKFLIEHVELHEDLSILSDDSESIEKLNLA